MSLRLPWIWLGDFPHVCFRIRISMQLHSFFIILIFAGGLLYRAGFFIGRCIFVPRRTSLSESIVKANFCSLKRFLPHNDIFGFWLDPYPLPFKGNLLPSLTPPRGLHDHFSFLFIESDCILKAIFALSNAAAGLHDFFLSFFAHD